MTMQHQRNTFVDGTAEILVIDFFEHLWPDYASAIPACRRLMIVPDTTTASQVLAKNPAIRAVVIQGLSRRRASDSYGDSLGNTMNFVNKLLDTGWPWRVYVVSKMIEPEVAARIMQTAPAQIKVLDKFQFLGHASKLLGKHIDTPLVPQKAWREMCQQRKQHVRDHIDDETEAARLEAGKLAHDLWVAECKLLGFNQVITTGDPRAILVHLVEEMETHPLVGGCPCKVRAAARNWWGWLHQHHSQYNLAVWEALAADRDVLELVHYELEADLQSHGSMPGYGRIVRKDRGRQLLQLLGTSRPSRAWV